MTKKFKWYEQPFRWANIILIVITLLTYLISFINPNYSGWLSILGLTYPILLFGNIFFLSFWLYRKRLALALSTFLCILVGWNYLTATVGLNYFASVPKVTEQKLSIVSYNVRNFRITGQFDRQKRTKKIAKTLQFITEKEPDILCSQELKFPYKGSIKTNEVKEHLNYFPFMVTNKQGLVICSKYPIINNGEVNTSAEEANEYTNLFADIQINNEFIVRVYSLHLESNKVSQATENMDLDKEKLQTKSTWRAIFNVLGTIKNNQKLRATQIKAITEHIKGSPYPVVVCGDFNDTPLSYTVRQTNFLQDNFSQTGTGIASTYNGNIPFLRIDYILSDKRFGVMKTEVMKEYSASDHFPMMSTICWEFE